MKVFSSPKKQYLVFLHPSISCFGGQFYILICLVCSYVHCSQTANWCHKWGFYLYLMPDCLSIWRLWTSVYWYWYPLNCFDICTAIFCTFSWVFQACNILSSSHVSLFLSNFSASNFLLSLIVTITTMKCYLAVDHGPLWLVYSCNVFRQLKMYLLFFSCTDMDVFTSHTNLHWFIFGRNFFKNFFESQRKVGGVFFFSWHELI